MMKQRPAFQYQAMALLLAGIACSPILQAATWVKLNENAQSKLLLDKQSIVTQAALKKVWVKVEYKTPQKNPDSVDKLYNLSKALWHFNCENQTFATTQVFQYLNQELVYSASVEMKGAEFIEPMPESDLQIAMHYVCKSNQPAPAVKPPASNANPAKTNVSSAKADTTKNSEAAKPAEDANNKPIDVAAKAEPSAEAVNPEPTQPANSGKNRPAQTTKKPDKTTANEGWGYIGKIGPNQWSNLNAEFTTCSTGVNQSPVAFDNTIHAALKPIRVIDKFPAKEILNTPSGLRIMFREGNMMVLDKTAFQLKHIDLHTPSEHQLNGQTHPMEMQLWHEDNKKNIAIMSILFKAGEPNSKLAELISHLPKKAGEPSKLKNRVTPKAFMPSNPQYYRYNGSLTTPPCTEGIRWIVMKTTMQASDEQVKAINNAIGVANNRPIQPLHGRSVLE